MKAKYYEIEPIISSVGMVCVKERKDTRKPSEICSGERFVKCKKRGGATFEEQAKIYKNQILSVESGIKRKRREKKHLQELLARAYKNMSQGEQMICKILTH